MIESKYQIVLIAKDGSHISDWHEADNLKRAKEIASHLLSDEWAKSAESTHDDTGKVEIRDRDGQCVWDRFYDHS